MSAHDDYPYFPNPRTHAIERRVQYDAMCDEIDVRRAKARADDMVFNAINELVRELTAHADAMRGLLEEAALNALSSDMWADEKNGNKYMKAITAYDEFVKEC